MEKKRLFRTSNGNCCVAGCRNAYYNTDSSIKFYNLPGKPYEIERRMAWIQRIKTINEDMGRNWKPRTTSKICSAHFVGNRKCNIAQSPAYNPTIFLEMPRRCCIPNCKSNYESYLKKNNNEIVSTFTFPRDENSKQKWLTAIGLGDFQPSLRSVVCCKHFTDGDIIRYDKLLLPDGSLQPLLLRRPKLSEGAVPSQFENMPSSESKSLTKSKKGFEITKFQTSLRTYLPQFNSKKERTRVEVDKKLINQMKRQVENYEDPFSQSFFDHQYLLNKIHVSSPVVTSKSKSYCSVPQCYNYCSETISMHRFPKNPKRKRCWQIAMKIGKPISKFMVVCSQHFCRSDYLNVNNGAKKLPRLKQTAVPSQKVPVITYPLNRTVKKGPLSKKKIIADYDVGHSEDSLEERSLPFETEFLPQFNPMEESDTGWTEKITAQAKEDCDPLALVSFNQRFITEKNQDDSPSLQTSCSSFVNSVYSSRESISDVIIKTESDDSGFDMEGKQYAEDLRLLLPEQRNIVRELLADIICRAKVNLLPRNCFLEL